MRRPVARLTRIVDGWFPVRRMRMTGAVAAAMTAYAAMLALQLSMVVPVPGEASTASPVAIGGGLLTISAQSGVCVLPVCLLAPRCAASVGGGCLLPAGSPPPATPKPAPPAPPAAPAAAAVAPAHPATAHPAAAARSAPHAAAVHAASAKAAAPVSEVTRVDRPVIAAPVEVSPPLTSAGPLPTVPVAVAPSVPAPSPAGAQWWLYAIFVAVDGGAAVALTVLIRRTAAAQAQG